MNRLRSLNLAFVVIVFLIMISSGALSGTFIYILYKCNIVNELVPRPMILTFVIPLTSIIIGTIISLITSRRVLKPLNELINATKEIAKGNFSVQVVNDHNCGELGDLISSFNDMARQLNGVEMVHRDFINNFSHEFKTPIISIRGFAKQLKNSSLTNDEREEYADIIIREAERLTNMSTNILILDKLENQVIVSNKTKFSLDEQLRNCILLLQKQWESKNLELQIDLSEVTIFNNEEMLEQVWLNLIGNAIKYSPENSKLTIECYQNCNEIKIKIVDSGIGMTDEVMAHIFDKFYQGDLAHKSEGNGLGLSIAKRILDLCDGKISVKSKLGKGSIFTIRLAAEE